MSNKIPYKTYLEESEMPKQWLNLKAFMKEQHEPFIHPGTMKTMCKRRFITSFSVMI